MKPEGTVEALLGVGGNHVRTSMRYIYLGKMRSPADYPMMISTQLECPPSHSRSIPLSARLPNPRTSSLRASKGQWPCFAPQPGPARGIESWMSQVGRYTTTGESFVLAPVLSDKQWELLAKAELISKIEVRVDAERNTNLATSGKVGSAIQGVMDLSDHEATLQL